MELIKKLGVRQPKNGKYKQSWGLFLCPFCNKEVEKILRNGKRDKSCGCSANKLISISKTKYWKENERRRKSV